MNPRTQPFGLNFQNAYIAAHTDDKPRKETRWLLCVTIAVLVSLVSAYTVRAVSKANHLARMAAMPTASPEIEKAYQRGLKAGLERPHTYNLIDWRCK